MRTTILSNNVLNSLYIHYQIILNEKGCNTKIIKPENVAVICKPIPDIKNKQVGCDAEIVWAEGAIVYSAF